MVQFAIWLLLPLYCCCCCCCWVRPSACCWFIFLFGWLWNTKWQNASQKNAQTIYNVAYMAKPLCDEWIGWSWLENIYELFTHTYARTSMARFRTEYMAVLAIFMCRSWKIRGIRERYSKYRSTCWPDQLNFAKKTFTKVKLCFIEANQLYRSFNYDHLQRHKVHDIFQ